MILLKKVNQINWVIEIDKPLFEKEIVLIKNKMKRKG
jgi:hypothetical protein